MQLCAWLQSMVLEEARLVRELDEMEKDRQSMAAGLDVVQAETQMLHQQDEQHQRDYSKLGQQQLELQGELPSMENRLQHVQVQVGWLEKTDAFGASFRIWHDGPLGILNNFRLGCLPTVPVPWNEINAAWGQTALLLFALSRTIGLEFQRYQLVPCGNHSYLRSLADDLIELPLFCKEGQSSFLYNKFDRAMTALLNCMQQFKEEAEKGELGLCLPYRIHVDKGLMEDPGSGGFYSIRTHLNVEEQ